MAAREQPGIPTNVRGGGAFPPSIPRARVRFWKLIPASKNGEKKGKSAARSSYLFHARGKNGRAVIAEDLEARRIYIP